jgi:hypothetical protein
VLLYIHFSRFAAVLVPAIHPNLRRQVLHRRILSILRLGFKLFFFIFNSLTLLIMCFFTFISHYLRLHVSSRNCRMLRRYFRDRTQSHATVTEITLFHMACAGRHNGLHSAVQPKLCVTCFGYTWMYDFVLKVSCIRFWKVRSDAIRREMEGKSMW